MGKYTLFFRDIGIGDVPLVGGKTASLGEMSKIKLPVPGGFAITSKAYWYFLDFNNLRKKIKKILDSHNIKNVKQLAAAGKAIRGEIIRASFPEDLEKDILLSFKKLRCSHVAIRSSATAEDLPDASFAGQQESYMNVTKKDLLEKVKMCFASLFTDRAISYREDKKFGQFKVALSVAVQKQIFSEASGVMFTLDPDSGHRSFVYINGSWGLGDYVVQGKVNPDEFFVLKQTGMIIEKKLGGKKIMEVRGVSGVKKKKVTAAMQERFVLSDKEALELAGCAMKIEEHYKRPMDIEWAKERGKLYIVQARPETVQSMKNANVYEEFMLKEKGKTICTGLSIGRKISSGLVNVIPTIKQISRFKQGQILVTRATDPDWEPIMKMASGIITETGGRTCHAAIVSRELGVPAIVGITGATKILKSGQKITIDCTEEIGKVWNGALKYDIEKHDIKKLPKTRTKLYANVGEPEKALSVSQLPVDGVGLAREEFIIMSHIGEHPLAMIEQGREKEYIDKLASGIAKIAAAFYPRPIIVRTSDFKSNEYKNLKGGEKFEADENNPMIGWRGAGRYVGSFEPAFRLECRALKKVIHDMKLTNVKVMIPFCRTLEEADNVLKIIRSERLVAEVGVMAEIPSNIILTKEFSKRYKFFSIGSNDLTQLTLGMDRDNEKLPFDERNAAVKKLIKELIREAHKMKRTVGICGEAPSNYPEFAEFLVKLGIDSMSVEPDVAVKTRLIIANAEKKRRVGTHVGKAMDYLITGKK